MNLIYCFGIIKNKTDIDIYNIAFQPNYPIEFQKYRDIIAIICNVPSEEFSQEAINKKVKDMKWLTNYAQKHESVIKKIFEKTTIIPMKFCTIFKDKKNLIDMLEEKYENFLYNFKRLEDKYEIGVKVYYDTDKSNKEILDSNPDIMKKDKEIKELSKSSPGKGYFENQKIVLNIKEKLQIFLSSTSEEIFEKIKSRYKNSKKNDLLDKKATGKDMLLNCVFMIDKLKVDEFKSYVNDIKSKYSSLNFEIWGPFPCYNFVK